MLSAIKIIGLKEFRSNISTLWKVAQKRKIRYIVMHHSQPVFEVTPIVDGDILIKLAADIAEAREAVKQGKVYTEKQVLKKIGL